MPWQRVLVEGVVIVLSILLAFGIDSWWDARAERARTRDHLLAVRSELSENARLLDRQAEVCERGRAAALDLLSMMGPNPDPIPPDSVVSLLAEVLWPGVGNRLSTTAIEAMVAEGQVAAIMSADLQRGLGDWFSSDLEQRTQQRENARVQLRETRAYVGTVMPYALVPPRWPSQPDFPESRFPLDVDRVLSDATLEGSLTQLVAWKQGLCTYDLSRSERVGVLLGLVDAELAR